MRVWFDVHGEKGGLSSAFPCRAGLNYVLQRYLTVSLRDSQIYFLRLADARPLKFNGTASEMNFAFVRQGYSFVGPQANGPVK